MRIVDDASKTTFVEYNDYHQKLKFPARKGGSGGAVAISWRIIAATRPIQQPPNFAIASSKQQQIESSLHCCNK